MPHLRSGSGQAVEIVDNRDNVVARFFSRGRDESAISVLTPGNRVMALGDSITASGHVGLRGYRATGYLQATSYLGWAMLLSGGRIRHAGAAATGTLTIDQIANQKQSDGFTDLEIILRDKPAACVVLAGTNDVGNGTTPAAMKDGLTNIYTRLLSAGITPICCSLPPRNTDGVAARSALIQLNVWIARYAEQNGLPFVDFHAALTDPANGNWAAGLNGDNIHQSGLGAKEMGKAICDRLVGTNYLSGVTGLSAQMLPAWMPPVALENSDQSSGILSNNKLNLTDSGAPAGLATGWTQSGGTPTLAADAANIKGNYQILTRAGADCSLTSSGSVPISKGDIVGWAAKVSSTVKASGASCHFRLMTNNGEDLLGIRDWLEDIPAGSVISGEVVVPSTFTGPNMLVAMYATLASGAVAKIAQVQTYNLSALGVV